MAYREGPDNKDVFSGGMGRPAEAWCQDFVPLVALCQGLASAGLTASAFRHPRRDSREHTAASPEYLYIAVRRGIALSCRSACRRSGEILSRRPAEPSSWKHHIAAMRGITRSCRMARANSGMMLCPCHR